MFGVAVAPESMAQFRYAMVTLNCSEVADAVDSNGDAVDSNGSSSEVDQKGSSAVAESRGGLSPTHRPANAVDETNQGYNHSAPFPVFHMNRIGEETQFFSGEPAHRRMPYI